MKKFQESQQLNNTDWWLKIFLEIFETFLGRLGLDIFSVNEIKLGPFKSPTGTI